MPMIWIDQKRSTPACRSHSLLVVGLTVYEGLLFVLKVSTSARALVELVLLCKILSEEVC